jgi:hypothetical protein
MNGSKRRLYVYLAAYNEADIYLTERLKSGFEARGHDFAVVYFGLPLIQSRYESAGIRCFNLGEKPDLSEQLDWAAEVRDMERHFGRSFGALNDYDVAFYEISAERSERNFRRSLAATHAFFAEHAPAGVVQKLGGEPFRLAFDFAAKRNRAWNVYIGSFPNIFPDRAFIHESILYERAPGKLLRDDTPAEIRSHVRAAVDAHLGKREPISYPVQQALTDRDFPALVGAAMKGRYRLPLELAIRRRIYLGRQVLNGIYARWKVKPRPPSGSYFFFPLHVTNDSQITLRNPAYKDQVALIRSICHALPHGTKLVVKMHPGLDGMLEIRALRALSRLPNCILVDTSERALDLARDALGTIVINSTVALEALLINRPVIVLGMWSLSGHGLTIDVESLNDLPAAFERCKSFTPSFDRTLTALETCYQEMAPANYFKGRFEPTEVVDFLLARESC